MFDLPVKLAKVNPSSLYTILVELQYPMLHTNFKAIGPLVRELVVVWLFWA